MIISRQLQWQRDRQAAGLCRQCGKPAAPKGLCAVCRGKRSDLERNRYRLKHGIPLDLPITRGRPRLAPIPVYPPAFFASDDAALADMRRCAELEAAP